jgi:hypothetical protein
MDTTSQGILCPDSNESNSTPHILTADEVEAILNYVDPEPIKTAITALYKRDDIIEVRAWDKQHNVYTGRYTRSKKLMEHIKLWNENCDVYYVLNPVGDKHGLRDMSKGGLCTWEQDVPWRQVLSCSTSTPSVTARLQLTTSGWLRSTLLSGRRFGSNRSDSRASFSQVLAMGVTSWCLANFPTIRKARKLSARCSASSRTSSAPLTWNVSASRMPTAWFAPTAP